MARAEVYERLVRQVPQVRFVVRQVMIRRDHGDQLTSGRAAALDGLRFRTRRQAEERDVDAAPPDPFDQVFAATRGERDVHPRVSMLLLLTINTMAYNTSIALGALFGGLFADHAGVTSVVPS